MTYDPPQLNPPLSLDPTAFAEEEDFDFGLFLHNLPLHRIFTVGEAFIGVFGDITSPPDNGRVRRPVGCRVIWVNPCNGVVQDFDEISPQEMNDLIAYIKVSRRSAYPFLLKE